MSDIEHPCVLVAAMVVSDMKERLSPKKAPPATIAVMNPVPVPDSAAIPAATGTRATMVPTLVPMAIEMKQEAMKRPAKSIFPGNIAMVRATVASIAPIILAVSAKAPARMKIQSMRRTFLLPAPSENTEMRSSMVFPLLIINA